MLSLDRSMGTFLRVSHSRQPGPSCACSHSRAHKPGRACFCCMRAGPDSAMPVMRFILRRILETALHCMNCDATHTVLHQKSNTCLTTDEAMETQAVQLMLAYLLTCEHSTVVACWGASPGL